FVFLGMFKVGSAIAQLDMQVSPRTWVLETAGLGVIDVHIATPFSQVDTIDNVVVSNSEKVVDADILSVGADLRGDLVIKFTPDQDALVDGDILTVEVTGQYVDEGGPILETFEGVEVKEAEMLNKE
ncbi:hypothetical protein KKE45_02765, partial [Patescibacteria group bacterium]|nr:hypothetical protein [Patescibacteria group bacterium]